MDALIGGSALLLAFLMALGLYRATAGPTVFDRVLAVGWLSMTGIILIALIGFIYDRIDMFVDIALAYSLLNFVINIALAKYFEHGGASQP